LPANESARQFPYPSPSRPPPVVHLGRSSTKRLLGIEASTAVVAAVKADAAALNRRDRRLGYRL